MTASLRLFLRGYVIVLLTALNVGEIAGQHYYGAFLCGGAISYVWWTNAHSAAHDRGRFAREAYTLGAACGTVSGMLLYRYGGFR